MPNSEAIFAEERKERILQIVNREKRIVVPKLTEIFGVSATTIRKDLKELEDSKLLLRTHGGAMCITKSGYEELPSRKGSMMLLQKQAIARSALEFIQDGDTIALLTGTTVMELVKLLRVRSNLTVVVNDLQFAAYLERQTDFRIYMLSGVVRNNYHYVVSPMRCELLSLLNIDKAFITCNGFTEAAGATTPDLENALKFKEILEHTSTTYLLCDSSKIGLSSFAQIAPAADIGCIITDDGITDDDWPIVSGVAEVVIAKVNP